MGEQSEVPRTISRQDFLKHQITSMSEEDRKRVFLIKPGVLIYDSPDPLSDKPHDGVIQTVQDSEPEFEGYYVMMEKNSFNYITKGQKPIIKGINSKMLRMHASIEDVPIKRQEDGIIELLGSFQEKRAFNIFSNPAWLSYPSILPGGIQR